MPDETIGPYRILAPLGRGGMGVVYRARHLTSDRAVALKTVSISAPKWLDSIRREIQALTRIRHPGIVRILEHGVHQGLPWYAMDLLEGESLRSFGQRIWSQYRDLVTVPPTSPASHTAQLTSSFDDVPVVPNTVKGNPTPLPQRKPPAGAGELRTAIRIVRRLCTSVAFLHGEGLVNCDLKPENVLLVEGRPVVIDFGLTARHPGSSGREEVEALRAMSGTAPYMSPEQIRGEFVDARSDLYGIGCILYELVCGATPFSGSRSFIANQHLHASPPPPRELVTDIPPTLERIILKLLEKERGRRYGYADEVAAELAQFTDEPRSSESLPPPRPYLYRPQLVGRSELLATLAKQRDAAREGSGGLTLVAGESGVGKTRLAIELTRLPAGSPMRVIASEASALSAESAAAVGPAPLHALRPLLRAVADRCHEEGSETTELLLGHRRSILAMYEPLLGQVPAEQPLQSIVPLPAAASRQRLFKYLAETLAYFAVDRPVLWILDDLGWADELSLAFLASLTPDYLQNTPLFILGTYRSEEVSPEVAQVAQLNHVTHIKLPRLDSSAVGSMISDMLALPNPPPAFVESMARQAEGNPFFVAEYLRTAVTERLLYRGVDQSWQIPDERAERHRNYDSLAVPNALRELIERRLRRLSPAAQHGILAAAVLGREVELDVLREVAALSDEAALGAVNDGLRREIFEQTEPNVLRFTHDKFREVAYASAGPAVLQDLHRRAATVLEQRLASRSEAHPWLAMLGHHFAAARVPDNAAQYLKRAGDHARTTYANRDAQRLYREAINQVDYVLSGAEVDTTAWTSTLVDLNEALGDVLAVAGGHDEARAAYEQALLRSPHTTSLPRARFYRKLGNSWATHHQHERSLACYMQAEQVLPANPQLASPAERDEWLQLKVDQVWVHYWLNRSSELETLCQSLRPLMSQLASPSQRARFYNAQTLRNLRRDRYVINEETLGFARDGLAASKAGAPLPDLHMAQFTFGFVLLHHDSLDSALTELLAALKLAQRAGDVAQQARVGAYVTLAARRLGRVEEARAHAERTAKVAEESGQREYVAAARANRAWVLLRQGIPDEAAGEAAQAWSDWRGLPAAFPFLWVALLPLLEVELGRGKLEQAVACAKAILQPNQQALPGLATDALEQGISHFATGKANASTHAFRRALAQLGQTGHR